MIDDALMRPGRFDRVIHVPPPDFDSRIEIFKLYTRGFCLKESDYSILAKHSNLFTGADIRKVCHEVVLNRIHLNLDMHTVTVNDILATLKETSPSINAESMEKYNKLQRQLGG